MNADQVAMALRARYKPAEWLVGFAVRRLMPIECERLMGWPDNHSAPAGADVHRYRLCGNGVVAPIAQWIFDGIINNGRQTAA